MKAKYIIVTDGGLEFAIIFDKILAHKNISAGRTQVVSAGFCSLDSDGVWHTYGKSESLSLDSRPQDAKILNRIMDYA